MSRERMNKQLKNLSISGRSSFVTANLASRETKGIHCREVGLKRPTIDA